MAVDSSIYVRKLDSDKDFEQILKYNKIKINEWLPHYPNHLNWITSVVEELKSDNYSRIVFGGFYHTQNKKELSCSAIVKKNQFSDYLEIKNVIVFKVKDQADHKNLTREYQSQLIVYIKEFAQKRGYSKLVTELSKKKDKELINIFLENDFLLTGSQQGRYNPDDETVFLSFEINQLYGFDPYDSFSSSSWILAKNLKCQQLTELSNEVQLLNKDNKKLRAPAFSFFNGRIKETEPEKKFNSKNLLIILEEDFRNRNNSELVTELNITEKDFSRVYLFDYTKESDSNFFPPNVRNKLAVFTRTELLALMGYKEETIKHRRFDHKDVGGLLLISNPDRFDIDNAKKLIQEGKSPIYIKLGDYGTYINDTMPLVLAYYPDNSNRSTLEIWAICRLQALPLPMNINTLRVKDSQNLISGVTDADYLYNEIVDLLGDEDENFEDSILWKRPEFNKHNRYNEAQRVVVFCLRTIYDLPPAKRIKLEDVLENSSFLDETENIFDFYLNHNEANKILASANINFDQQDPADSFTSSLDFLYTFSMPDDQLRPGIDYDEIYKIVSQEKSYINSLNPVMETNYLKLLKQLKDSTPHIIHFSGHGNQDGLKFKDQNTGNTELLSNDQLTDLFSDESKNLKLVVLNCCYSEIQAKIISMSGVYVIGIKDQIESKMAIEFSSTFYLGFCSKIRNGLKTAIRVGITSFSKSYPDKSGLISLWKDGNEIKIDQI